MEGFMKYQTNSVVQLSQITCIWENGGKIHFSTPELGDDNFWNVDKEYEPKWREVFDLND